MCLPALGSSPTAAVLAAPTRRRCPRLLLSARAWQPSRAGTYRPAAAVWPVPFAPGGAINGLNLDRVCGEVQVAQDAAHDWAVRGVEVANVVQESATDARRGVADDVERGTVEGLVVALE